MGERSQNSWYSGQDRNNQRIGARTSRPGPLLPEFPDSGIHQTMLGSVEYQNARLYTYLTTLYSGDQGLSRNASSVSFGHAEHCFLTVWTLKML